MSDQAVLLEEMENLRARLDEALATLEAIAKGGVDAIVVHTEDGEKIFTLQGAEQPYRVMVEAINEGAATLSEDGLIVYANACLGRLLKMPLETILGSPMIFYVAPQDRKAFEAILEQGQRENCKTEIGFQAQDGTHVPVLLSLSPVRSPDQVSICVVATDLTEQRRNIEILAAERIASSIIEQAAESIIVCNASGKIIRASRTAYQLAGQNPLFKPFDAVFPLRFDPVSESGSRFSLPAVLSGEVFQGVEASLEHCPSGSALGETYSLLVSATPLTIPDEGTIGCVITMTDLTERRRAEEAICNYNLQLERSNKDLLDFAYIASHDLQEPLRKIRAFGNILKEKNSSQLSEEACDYIGRMQKAAIRMEKMINDLLAYSRVSTQTRSFDQIDLNRVAREVLLDLETRITQTGGRVEVGELPVIEADPLQMRQLLQNLLSNALKFHKKDISPAVKVGAKFINANLVEIAIEDNGIGFEIENIDRVFQPFQRLHGRSEYEGSGIGLAICQKIIERHLGKITAQSTPGVGTSFFVTLPVTQQKKN